MKESRSDLCGYKICWPHQGHQFLGSAFSISKQLHCKCFDCGCYSVCWDCSSLEVMHTFTSAEHSILIENDNIRLAHTNFTYLKMAF
ncbi:hypothetical protein GOP47_0014299 [Adiantum capillus-veneris]|uniref:Uncharacterized protein n=1 Tax=Adiantum capillus-veneris TaxID=13818 RepID=A0A9D4ZEQ7_ADICA|nr:hypothetical protein GOP47_0014299 [Adiantum capillus-veneris]